MYLCNGKYVVNTGVNLIKLIQFQLAGLLPGGGGGGSVVRPSCQNPNLVFMTKICDFA